MTNTRFEAYKLKRELKRSGIDYEFQRLGVNDFGEPDDEPTVVGSLKGLYHEQNSNIEITTGDTTRVRTKKIHMRLCLFDDATSLALKIDDFLFINKKKFKVTGIVNIQEWSIISDISLEVVDDGVQT